MSWPLALVALALGGAYGWLTTARQTPARARVGGGVVLAALVIWLALADA